MFIELKLYFKVNFSLCYFYPYVCCGKNYKSLIDDDDECNNRSVMRWTNSSKAIDNKVTTIKELIDFSVNYLILILIRILIGKSI